MADDDLEELLEAGAAALDDVVGEAVGEDLAGQGGDGDAGALALEDVAEVLEVAVAAAHAALAQLEGGDVGAADDLVVGVHVARGAVGARAAHLDLEEVLGRPVDLVEGLVARVRHRLHYGPGHARHAGQAAGDAARRGRGRRHRRGGGGVVGRRRTAGCFSLRRRRFDDLSRGVFFPRAALYAFFSFSSGYRPQMANNWLAGWLAVWLADLLVLLSSSSTRCFVCTMCVCLCRGVVYRELIIVKSRDAALVCR